LYTIEDMEHQVDNELRGICEEIRREGKSEAQWAEVEASDWFQTPHYCGGFDATDMHFAFTVYVGDRQYCFALSLADALMIADSRLDRIEIEKSPWDSGA
jgi:hypothetical protein